MVWTLIPVDGKSANQKFLRYAGVVKDSITGETLPFASIQSKKNYSENIVANENGAFLILSRGDADGWMVNMPGYEPHPILFDGSDSTHIIKMSPMQKVLDEIIVRPKKERYSKKNNPAVDFINLLRKMSHYNNPESLPRYSYDQYEKTLIAINDFNNDFSKGFLSKGGSFLRNYLDTSSWTGKRILNLMLKEKVATRLVGQNPKIDKEIMRGYRSSGIDEMINQDNVRIVLEDAVREIDVFSDNITLLQNRFVSPLSSLGPDFYKYYLTDTIFVGDEKCIELSFVPRNSQSMGFNGKIYVPVGDSTMFVKKISMRTPSNINMNLIDNIFINLSFEKDSLGFRHKVYDDVCIEMSLIPQAPKLYGRKTTVNSNFSYEIREDLGKYYNELGKYFAIENATARKDDFWYSERPIPLTRGESALGGLLKTARKNKVFYVLENVIRLLESGYVKTGNPSKIDLGPINTLISGNTVEGVRFRIGGMTMAPLNPHLFASGYVAYGTRDHKIKYNAEVEYSFKKKKSHSYEWQRHSVFAHYRYDVDMLGQHYLFTNSDNVFLSLKRKKSILATYQRLFELGYILELPNNFSVETKFISEEQQSTKWVPFVFKNGDNLSNYRQSGFSLSLRWAPGEKFIQGRTTRRPVNMDAWIFQLRQDYYPRQLFGGAFTLNSTELSIQKRLWLSAFGYTDIILKGGIIWSSVYFPALMWPNANLSYTIQPESYSLMNPMEFANDKYASIDFTYYGMGVLFNRIPLINRLKLREVVTFKGLMGGLSNRNNPDKNSSLLSFPFDAHPEIMSEKPYMEIGAGIDNILMFLRVDYVWRLTYRNTPGCDKSGLRVSLHFSF